LSRAEREGLLKEENAEGRGEGVKYRGGGGWGWEVRGLLGWEYGGRHNKKSIRTCERCSER